MSGFDENPFGEPTVDNPFAVRIFNFVAKYSKQNALAAYVAKGFWFISFFAVLCSRDNFLLVTVLMCEVRIWFLVAKFTALKC